MSIWQLTAWKKNINLVEITQTIFITNYNRIYLQAKPFMNPPRSCPIDIFCRFHWIPVSGSESDYKEIGLEDINTLSTASLVLLVLLVLVSIFNKLWNGNLMQVMAFEGGRLGWKRRKAETEINWNLSAYKKLHSNHSCARFSEQSTAPLPFYTLHFTLGENNQKTSQRPALCLLSSLFFFLPNNN